MKRRILCALAILWTLSLAVNSALAGGPQAGDPHEPHAPRVGTPGDGDPDEPQGTLPGRGQQVSSDASPHEPLASVHRWSPPHLDTAVRILAALLRS